MSRPTSSPARALALGAIAALVALPAQAKGPKDPPPDKPPTARLIKDAGAIAEGLGTSRELGPTGPIDKGIYDEKQLRERLLSMIAQEYTDAEIADEASALGALGALPQGLDYKALMVELLTEQIAGFYDPKAKELFIMKGLPQSLQRPTMAHELFHAIQDQHFDLQSIQGPFNGKENSDFALARSALIEGDATLVMLDFSLYESKTLPDPNATSMADMKLLAAMVTSMSMDDIGAMEQMLGGDKQEADEPSAIEAAPLFIRESLMFPYLAGLRFAVAARAGRTWKDLDAVYADPPVSTEQILHPERFFQKRDDPVFLSFSLGAPAKDLTPLYQNVLGEYQLYLLLKEGLTARGEGAAKSSPAEASAGWDGDTLRSWRAKDGAVVTAHVSEWDSARDAAQWAAAMREVAARRHADLSAAPTARVEGADVTRYTHSGGARELIVERRGATVLYLDGLPHAAMPTGQEFNAPVFKARDAAFSTLERDDLPTAIAAAKRRRAAEEAKEAKEAAKKKSP
jgi:hypothetical protein